MNQLLFEILICPTCKGNLQLFVFEKTDVDNGNVIIDQMGREVIAGLLKCGCGTMYPIIEGVPRFLDGGVKQFPAFIAQHRLQLERICGCEHPIIPSESGQDSSDYENIRNSFSQEWGLFDYNGDKTWGWTLEERVRVFIADLNMGPDEFAGKRLLDAGCGNGTLTAVLSNLGLKVIGIDLNDGLGLAQRNRAKYSTRANEYVQYVQGNILQPPLMTGVFDLVYSSGVIHHTPDSKRAYESLVSLTKKGGRLYIWVYGKRALPVRIFFKYGRLLKSRISLRSLVNFCRLLAPFYKVAAETLNFLHISDFRKRTTREITLDLFDAFAPRYNHYHTETEVKMWFQESGFTNICVSGRQKHGFGMYGDKI